MNNITVLEVDYLDIVIMTWRLVSLVILTWKEALNHRTPGQ